MANRQKPEVKGDMNLPKLVERFGSEDKCHAYLEELRWPDGVECPRCESKKISRIASRRQFDCDGCRYQFSVRVGTLFHDSKLPLWKWFLATYLMIESKKGMSANQLKRTLVVSYKTAWYLCHRIRSAMEGGEEAELLRGVIEADETWIGGYKSERDGGGRSKRHLAIVLGAVERGGDVHLRLAKSADHETVHKFLKDVVEDADAIYTDSWRSYQGIGRELGDGTAKHQTVNHHAEEWVRGDVHTQTIESVWSLFKRSIVGSYHHMSVKHLPAYLEEMEWRFNNRENPFLFRDTLLRLVEGDALPYKALVTGTK
jgi:transposase-like protein